MKRSLVRVGGGLALTVRVCVQVLLKGIIFGRVANADGTEGF